MSGKRVNLFPEIIERKPEMGGVTVELMGRTGSGKTALLTHIARRIFEHKKRLKKKPNSTTMEKMIADEILFWIDDPDCQWRRLPNYVAKKRILAHRDIYNHMTFYQDGQPIYIPVIPFSSFDDMMKNLNPDALNVVYLPSREEYLNFLNYLVKVPKFQWVSVFVDELERILRQYISGDELKRLESLVDTMIRGRKRRLSIFAGTHNRSLVHWQFNKLIMYYAFLMGAREIPDTRVEQRCIDALEIGEFRLATAGSWDNPAKRFPAYAPKDDMIVDGLDEFIIPSPIGGGRPLSTTKIPISEIKHTNLTIPKNRV